MEKQAVGVCTEPLRPARSYIWQHIEIGYVQGMCDLLAPLLVILDDGECVFPSPGAGGAGSFLLQRRVNFVSPWKGSVRVPRTPVW